MASNQQQQEFLAAMEIKIPARYFSADRRNSARSLTFKQAFVADFHSVYFCVLSVEINVG